MPLSEVATIVGGTPAAGRRLGGGNVAMCAFVVSGGRIAKINIIANPGKLGRLPRP